MRRRQFIAGLGGAVALPLAARAQPAGRIPTIGVLWHAASPSEEQPYFDALLQGFKELGYVEGRNIKFEHRFPNEIPERFRQMAAELASLNVAAIVTVGNTTAPYAKQATSTIPIVFVFVNDPVGMKLINTLARPGGNITGQSVVGIDLTAKRFELLREIVPQVSRVGLLFNPAEPSGPQYLAEGKAAAAALGLTVLPFELGALNEMESVFARMVQAECRRWRSGPVDCCFKAKKISRSWRSLIVCRHVAGHGRHCFPVCCCRTDLISCRSSAKRRRSWTRFCTAPSRATSRSSNRRAFSSLSISGPPRRSISISRHHSSCAPTKWSSDDGPMPANGT